MGGKRLVVLIDAENIDAKYVKMIFDTIQQYGEIICCRIYNNWSKKTTWTKSILLEYGMQSVQQFDYVKGKNSADIAMVIDAMDLMATGKPEGFALVTGDSDFTRLALRLRQEGMFVLGFGRKGQTPESLEKAVNFFFELEEKTEGKSVATTKDKGKKPVQNASNSAVKSAQKNQAPKKKISEQELQREILVFMRQKGNQTVSPGELGSMLITKFPKLKFSDYGCKRLTDFLKKIIPGISIIGNKSVQVPADILPVLPDRNALEEEIRDLLRKHNGAINNLGFISTEMKKTHPEFSCKLYGFKNMTNLLKSFPEFQVSKNTVQLKNSRS